MADTKDTERPDFLALAESLDGKRMEFCGDNEKLRQAVKALCWAHANPNRAEFAIQLLVAAGFVSQAKVDEAMALPGAPQPVSGYQQALDIRTAQGWTLGGKAVPVLYTDTINGEQVLRDDVWLCTTAAFSAAPQPADAADGWMPIETAPHDGTYVILADAEQPNEGLLIGRRRMDSWWGKPTPSGKCTVWADATHWRPLPAPPSQDASKVVSRGAE